MLQEWELAVQLELAGIEGKRNEWVSFVRGRGFKKHKTRQGAIRVALKDVIVFMGLQGNNVPPTAYVVRLANMGIESLYV